MTDGENAQAGFTLLEMIVAFLILSISMAVASQTLSIAVSSYTRSEERQVMLELVETLEAGTVPAMALSRSGRRQGEVGNLQWTIDLVSPLRNEGQAAGEAFAIITIAGIRGKAKQSFLVAASLGGKAP